MQFTNVLALILVGAPLAVYADCYDSGENAFRQQETTSNLRSVCQNELSGNYSPGDSKVYCWMPPGTLDRKWNFKIERVGGSSSNTLFMDVDTCIQNISPEINGCPKGGRGTHGNWWFMADPNSGQC